MTGGDVVESTNAEVARTVERVFEHIRDRPEQSLAVVTVSEQHARRVAAAVQATAAQAPWAHEFLADFEADGGVIRNGSDLPRKARAEKILGLATAFGVHSTRYPDQDNAITAPSDTYHY